MITIILESFSYNWSLIDRNIHQVTRTLLSILADLKNAVVWMVSILPMISNFIIISWWFFTGVWQTPSLLKSPGLFSVFWPISAMLRSGWSRFFLWFPVSLLLLAGGFSLESEWQQVSSGLPDSSQYFGWF